MSCKNKEVSSRSFKSQFRLKDFMLPSGKKIQLMGYEPQVLKHLLEGTYTEDEFDFEIIPTIRYNETHFYFPDLYLPERNLIIEVKSWYTYELDLEKNLAKQKACLEQSYDFKFHIWDEKSGLTIL